MGVYVKQADKWVFIFITLYINGSQYGAIQSTSSVINGFLFHRTINLNSNHVYFFVLIALVDMSFLLTMNLCCVLLN